MDTLWFELVVASTAFALGQILFEHFDEKTPKGRTVENLAAAFGIAVLVSATLGRGWFFALLGLAAAVAVYGHACVLPRASSRSSRPRLLASGSRASPMRMPPSMLRSTRLIGPIRRNSSAAHSGAWGAWVRAGGYMR